jgi:hypothetical protein
MRVRRRLYALFVLAALLLAGCKADPATLLLVEVRGKPAVYDPMILDVTLTHDGTPYPTLLSKPGQTILLPTTFVIRADGRQGTVDLTIRAKDQNDRLVGEGKSTTTLIPDEQVNVTIELFPADFPINERYLTSQLFSTTSSGRQVSCDGKGNFVAVWEDSCPLGTDRCDVYYRMFDVGARPRLNNLTGKKEENEANDGNGYYDMPAVAVRGDGHFVTAWSRGDTAAADPVIRSRAFLVDGRPDDAANSGKEITLSVAGVEELGTPDVAALTDSKYVVVWHQKKGTEWQVVGRYLDPHGRPTKPTGAANNDPFLVAGFTYSAGITSDPRPSVSAGPSKGFMVVWRRDSKLWGRTYGEGATPNSAPFSISGGTADVGSFDIGPMLAGYAAIWSDKLSCGEDRADACIRMRRYNLVGAALENAWTVNTTTAGTQADPAIAMRDYVGEQHPEGSLLVTWSSQKDGTDDADGAVRGRRILSIGLPVGNDFRVNTTTLKKQERPSVVGLDRTSFVVVFRDWSGLGPDTDGAAIRGRVLYPEYATRDGQIGALCDSLPCATGLYCVGTNVGQRCVPVCQAPGADCPHGGKCEKLSGGLGNVCMYR